MSTFGANAAVTAGEVMRAPKVTGASRDGRHKLALLLEVIGKGDQVIVTKLGRLARHHRHVGDRARERREGAGFKSLAEPWCGRTTPAGELILTCSLVFERKRIKERQREGIAAAKARGVYRGGKKRLHDSAIWALTEAGLGATEIKRKVDASRRVQSIARWSVGRSTQMANHTWAVANMHRGLSKRG